MAFPPFNPSHTPNYKKSTDEQEASEEEDEHGDSEEVHEEDHQSGRSKKKRVKTEEVDLKEDEDVTSGSLEAGVEYVEDRDAHHHGDVKSSRGSAKSELYYPASQSYGSSKAEHVHHHHYKGGAAMNKKDQSCFCTLGKVGYMEPESYGKGKKGKNKDGLDSQTLGLAVGLPVTAGVLALLTGISAFLLVLAFSGVGREGAVTLLDGVARKKSVRGFRYEAGKQIFAGEMRGVRVQNIDYRCEDCRFQVCVSCVTIPNPDLLSSSQ
jgi:hypothetical protein